MGLVKPEEAPVSGVALILRGIDAVNEWLGKYISFAIIPLTVIVTTEVILRYIFHRPTIWAWDVSIQLAGLMAVLGGAYVFLHDGHVKVDVLANKLSPRSRAILDMVTAMLFFFAIGVLAWKASLEAWRSLLAREAFTSILQPPIYPFKMAVAAGAYLLLVQGLAKFTRNLLVAFPSLKRE